MANTYESKFKGVEVDEGVNIARNLTGTGGIEVKKTATGTINATVTIDGSGVKITPVSGTGTSTTDVMSQKAVTDELGKKQDELTVSSYIHINSLMADHAITLGNYSENVILLPQSGASGLVYFPKDGGYLATTGDIPAIVPITGTGTTTVMSQKAVTDELGKKQDKLTVSSNVHINSLTVAATSAADGLYFTNETGAGISYRILNAAGSGTAPLTRLTVPNDIAGKTQTIATREYVNAHSSSYNPGSGINISGNTISLDKRIMVDNITLGNYSSGNVILLPQSGASGNVYFPKYGGYLATTNDIPAPAKLYAHNFSITSNNLSQLNITFLFTIYLHTDTSITSLSQISSLYELYGYIPASGYIVDKADGHIKKGIAISYYVSEQMLGFYDISNGTEFAYYDTSKLVVSDTVIEV